MMPLSDDSGDSDHWMIMNSLALIPPSPHSSPLRIISSSQDCRLSPTFFPASSLPHCHENSTIHWFTIYWFTKNCQLFPKVTVSSLLWFLFHALWKLVVVHVSSVRLTLSGLSLSLSLGPGSRGPGLHRAVGDTRHDHYIMTSHSPLSGKYIFSN